MVRLTKWIIGLSLFTAALAIGATAFTGWQAWISSDALTFAKNSASDAGNQTQAALAISDRVAKATENQAAATELALGTSDRIATANERQVATYSAELKLAQSPNLDVVFGGIENYDFNSGFKATFRIVNKGTYTVRGAEVFAHSEPYFIDDINKVWGELGRMMVIDIVPSEETAHRAPLVSNPLTEKWWGYLINRDAAMVHAIRIRFKDANGKVYTIERCIAYNGPIEQIRGADCADYRQK